MRCLSTLAWNLPFLLAAIRVAIPAEEAAVDNSKYSNFQQATVSLAENLLKSEPIMRYHLANEQLQADQQATRLLKDLTQAQEELRRSQKAGQITHEAIAKIDQLQGQVQANTVILELAGAQQAATQYLQAINAEISNLVGLDFSALARRSSCC